MYQTRDLIRIIEASTGKRSSCFESLFPRIEAFLEEPLIIVIELVKKHILIGRFDFMTKVRNKGHYSGDFEV
jgi:hypothetical protein